MTKYLNITPSPVLYNEDGQVVDGYAWVELDAETAEAEAAWARGDFLKVASNGEFIYDSNEKPSEEEIVRPVTPEDVSRVKSRKNSEG